MDKKLKKTFGFTLIEVLVAATIIAVLTAVAAVSYSSINRRSRDARRKADIEQIRSALEFYKTDNNGHYPPLECVGNPATCSSYPASGLSAYLSPIVGTKYIDAVPEDPQYDGLDLDNIYYYWGQNESGAFPYGYCLSARLETGFSGTLPCEAFGGENQNYRVKNP